jgi:hypothetical protein
MRRSVALRAYLHANVADDNGAAQLMGERSAEQARPEHVEVEAG